ncbi:MAG: hypothetical protein M0025_02160 [Elusimicrobia bacterium]|nr:hypothetical protein [Elusimicrobiota bacterium]
MIKRWFKTAVILSLLAYSPRVFAERPAGAALGDLSGAVVLQGLDAIPSPSEIVVPLAAPAQDAVRASSPAPAPGRSLTPVIGDQNRAAKIMSLIGKIHNGQPLPYAHDGTIFTNKEGRLPDMPRGFYKEYTLIIGDGASSVVIGGTTYPVAPALSARGAERIIIGGGERIYYTPDHYAHFIELTIVY